MGGQKNTSTDVRVAMRERARRLAAASLSRSGAGAALPPHPSELNSGVCTVRMHQNYIAPVPLFVALQCLRPCPRCRYFSPRAQVQHTDLAHARWCVRLLCPVFVLAKRVRN